MDITAYTLAQRFIGMKEAKGPTSNAMVLSMLQLDTAWVQNDEIPWCFPGDVEILTAEGFERFSSLREGAMVAQVDPFQRVSWTVPTRYVRRHGYRGPLAHLSSRDVDLTCDPQHRFLGVWNRANAHAGPIELRPITDMTSALFVPRVATENEVDDPAWSDADLALMAAFVSDGFMHRGRIKVQVSKLRKLQALYALAPVKTYEAKVAYGISTIPLTTFEYATPSWMAESFTDYKIPKWDMLRSWSRRQLGYFLDAYANFDGHTDGGSAKLYTTMPRLRDWLQVATTLAGYHSSWRRSSVSPFPGRPCDEVVFAKDKATRTFRPDMIRIEDGEVDLHCVSVPSGVIVIRDRSGVVIPVGNCSAFVNYICWLLRLPRSKSLAARSWLSVGIPTEPMLATIGFDVVILKRGGLDQPGPEVIDAPGHVGFFSSLEGDAIWMIGGNQNDQVSLSRFPSERIIGIRRLL